MCGDVCRLLKVNPGKKSHTVSFPDLETDDLKWHFLRGLFDGDGCIVKPSNAVNFPICAISSSSNYMKNSIKEFCNISCCDDHKKNLTWQCTYAIRFLDKLYANATIFLDRKKNLYDYWKNNWKLSRRSKDDENTRYFKVSKTS